MSAPRLLTASDIPQAMALKQLAGWNQTEADWLRVIDLEPAGCFGIERDGRLAATAIAICYRRDLAWIGMVLTHPDYRGQGLATSLMRKAMEFVDSRQVRCAKLDATGMGAPLYRKMGFVDERPIERWVREPRAAPAHEFPEYEPNAALDREAFGADRGELLSRLAEGESAVIPGCGYAMGRPGANAAYFGPCVAVDTATAAALAEWFLGRHPGEAIAWDLLPDNREAVRLAQGFGFERTRRLVRMARPAEELGRVERVYAIAGFEFG